VADLRRFAAKNYLMKFDHVRNSKETTQLLGYLACLTISGGIASVFGVSWLLGFAIVMVIFRGWEKKHPFLSGRLQALTIIAFCLLSLAGNYSAYCEGVSAGYDAAGRVGKDRANQPAQTRSLARPV
jgi:hypothetical protein